MRRRTTWTAGVAWARAPASARAVSGVGISRAVLAATVEHRTIGSVELLHKQGQAFGPAGQNGASKSRELQRAGHGGRPDKVVESGSGRGSFCCHQTLGGDETSLGRGRSERLGAAVEGGFKGMERVGVRNATQRREGGAGRLAIGTPSDLDEVRRRRLIPPNAE